MQSVIFYLYHTLVSSTPNRGGEAWPSELSKLLSSSRDAESTVPYTFIHLRVLTPAHTRWLPCRGFLHGGCCGGYAPCFACGVNADCSENMNGHFPSGGAAWYAAYTEPRHEKFVQAQLVSEQQCDRFYPSIRRYAGGTTAYGEVASTLSWLRLCLHGRLRPSSRRTDNWSGLHRWEPHVTAAPPRSRGAGSHRRRPTRIAYATLVPVQRRESLYHSKTSPGCHGICAAARGRSNTRDHHSVDPEIFCDSCENRRPRISQLGFRASAPPRRRHAQ